MRRHLKLSNRVMSANSSGMAMRRPGKIGRGMSGAMIDGGAVGQQTGRCGAIMVAAHHGGVIAIVVGQPVIGGLIGLIVVIGRGNPGEISLKPPEHRLSQWQMMTLSSAVVVMR